MKSSPSFAPTPYSFPSALKARGKRKIKKPLRGGHRSGRCFRADRGRVRARRMAAEGRRNPKRPPKALQTAAGSDGAQRPPPTHHGAARRRLQESPPAPPPNFGPYFFFFFFKRNRKSLRLLLAWARASRFPRVAGALLKVSGRGGSRGSGAGGSKPPTMEGRV